MLIRVVPVGNPPEKILNAMCAQLESSLKIRFRMLAKVPVPKETYNQWRKQHNAETLMQIISNLPEVRFIDREIPSMAITDEDIYYRGLNYTFSIQDPQKSSCILSLARMRPEFYDDKPNDAKVTERLIKEAMHEIGHLKGLEHCTNPSCVMVFSASIAEVDQKKKEFCDRCKLKIMTRGIEL